MKINLQKRSIELFVNSNCEIIYIFRTVGQIPSESGVGGVNTHTVPCSVHTVDTYTLKYCFNFCFLMF